MTRTWSSGPAPGDVPPVGMPVAARVDLPRGRRRPVLWVVGVVLLAAGALSVVWLVQANDHKVAVLVAARDIPAGTVLADGDLGVVRVSVGPGVATIPAAERGELVGRVPIGALPAGTVLAERLFTQNGPPGAGRVLVPVALPLARMPLDPLYAGDRVLVVDTPATDADPPTTLPDSIPARIERVGTPDVNGVVVLDVSVATGDGPALAARSATGRIALVVQPRIRAAG